MRVSRFIVKDMGFIPGPTYYGVFDGDYKKFGLPERAVSLYFIEKTDAESVCEILNKEWDTFIRTGR